jgi:hypothetical protein
MIFKTDKKVDNVANRAMFDILIQPFYQVMESNQIQEGIQTQMVNYMNVVFGNLVKDNNKELVKILLEYIQLPESMSQMVISRANQLGKSKHDKIKKFILFYLLKKYLYWGTASKKLGIPIKPHLGTFGSLGMFDLTMKDYIEKFNEINDNSIQLEEVNYLVIPQKRTNVSSVVSQMLNKQPPTRSVKYESTLPPPKKTRKTPKQIELERRAFQLKNPIRRTHKVNPNPKGGGTTRRIYRKKQTYKIRNH